MATRAQLNSSGTPRAQAESFGAASRADHQLELPSRASRELLSELRRIARFDSVNLCLVGPSGTGKTLYAEEVHRRSPRATGPFVRINLASIDGGLATSELLGHVDGAFTGARGRRLGSLVSAHGGTLVLDEITKASTQVQHILLHLLDRDPVRPVGADRSIGIDVRFVALTSTPLETALRAGTLIPDLYERLKAFVLEIAPIVDRREDIPAVLAASLKRHAARFHYAVPPTIDREVIEGLERESLSGNHRELDGLVQRMLVNADGAPMLLRAHLPLRLRSAGSLLTSRRERYLADQQSGRRSTFATVREEARHYDVSVATIHRWRGERRDPLPLPHALGAPLAPASHESLMRDD